MNPLALLPMLVRSMPLLVVLAVFAAMVYVVVAAVRSPRRAKEVLIGVLTAVTAFLTVFFSAATAYAWIESNLYVMELAAACAVLCAAALAATRLARRRYLRRHPGAKVR